MVDFESQSARTLLALAGGRSGIDAARCALAFAHLRTAERVRGSLRSALARHQLSDLDFATLIVLFAGEPEAIPMSVLARHTAVSRSAMTDTLDKLERLQLASRTRDGGDRRIIRVRISAAGCGKVGQAINDYLHAATRAARHVGEPEACVRIPGPDGHRPTDPSLPRWRFGETNRR